MRSRPPSVLGVPFGDDPPIGEDGDPVREVLGFVHEVGGQEDGLAELAQPGDYLPGRPAGRGVEPGRRLVEEDDVGVADQRQCDIESPTLAARELAGAGVCLVGQPDQGDGVVDPAWRPVVAGVELEALPHGQAGLGLRFLQNDADPVPPRTAGLGRVDTQYADLAVCAFPEALEDLDRGGLAGTVGTEEGEDLAAVDFEVDPADRLAASVALDAALRTLTTGSDWSGAWR